MPNCSLYHFFFEQMANSTEQDKEYRGILNTIILMGYAILLFHFYVFCHNVLQQLGLPLGLLDRFIRSLNNATHVFDRVWFSKLVALFFLLTYVLGNRPPFLRSKSIHNVYKACVTGGSGLVIYFASELQLLKPSINGVTVAIIYCISITGGYTLLFISFRHFCLILFKGDMPDPFDEGNDLNLPPDWPQNPDSPQIPLGPKKPASSALRYPASLLITKSTSRFKANNGEIATDIE